MGKLSRETPPPREGEPMGAAPVTIQLTFGCYLLAVCCISYILVPSSPSPVVLLICCIFLHPSPFITFTSCSSHLLYFLHPSPFITFTSCSSHLLRFLHPIPSSPSPVVLLICCISYILVPSSPSPVVLLICCISCI